MFTQTGTTANLLFPFFLFSLHTHSRRLLRLKYTPDPLFSYLYLHSRFLIEARMAEWSKAVVSGTILFGGVGSNPTPCIFFSDSSIRLPSNSSTCVPLKTDCCLLYTFAPLSPETVWPSGLRRVTRNHFSSGGVGSNPAAVVFSFFLFLSTQMLFLLTLRGRQCGRVV